MVKIYIITHTYLFLCSLHSLISLLYAGHTYASMGTSHTRGTKKGEEYKEKIVVEKIEVLFSFINQL